MNSSIEPTLILGGGFVGLFTALHLSHKRYPLPTVLVDRSASFVFKPLLYEFFSGEMEADQICPSYEELLAGSNVTFVQDTVDAIDLNQRQVKLASGSSQRYGHLVLALGCTAGYFGLEGAIENSFPFRTQEDAIALAKQLRTCLQQAAQTSDVKQQRSLLTVAIIGAGATGVELAATLADLLPNWYSQLNHEPQKFRIVLIDRGSGVLKGKGDSKGNLCHTAHEALMQKTTVELCLEAEVTAVEPGQVTYRHEQSETIQAATIVWTAGIATHPLIKDLPIAPDARIKVASALLPPYNFLTSQKCLRRVIVPNKPRHCRRSLKSLINKERRSPIT
ncbi:NAD(P)/FAD-dependent oxidoreductase [Phormidesmis priestleyi]